MFLIFQTNKSEYLKLFIQQVIITVWRVDWTPKPYTLEIKCERPWRCEKHASINEFWIIMINNHWFNCWIGLDKLLKFLKITNYLILNVHNFFTFNIQIKMTGFAAHVFEFSWLKFSLFDSFHSKTYLISMLQMISKYIFFWLPQSNYAVHRLWIWHFFIHKHLSR